MNEPKDYHEFLGRLGRTLRGGKPADAPELFADRVMSRIAEERASAGGLGLLPAFAAAALVAVLGWASWRHHAGPVADAEIVTFAIDKTVTHLGQPVTLHWEVRNAEEVRIKTSEGAVLRDKSQDSATFLLTRPGAYRFVLEAVGKNGAVARMPMR